MQEYEPIGHSRSATGVTDKSPTIHSPEVIQIGKIEEVRSLKDLSTALENPEVGVSFFVNPPPNEEMFASLIKKVWGNTFPAFDPSKITQEKFFEGLKEEAKNKLSGEEVGQAMTLGAISYIEKDINNIESAFSKYRIVGFFIRTSENESHFRTPAGKWHRDFRQERSGKDSRDVIVIGRSYVWKATEYVYEGNKDGVLSLPPGTISGHRTGYEGAFHRTPLPEEGKLRLTIIFDFEKIPLK